jgi:hypothetical protein
VTRPESDTVTELYGFTVGDRVRTEPEFKAGDVWRIDRLYRGDPDAPEEWQRVSFAGLRLVDRVGGLPLGQTGTAVPLSRLRPVGGRRDAGRAGDIDPAIMREVIDGWVRTAKENHDALGHRGEDRPCWETWHVADFRSMIGDAVAETTRRRAKS